MQHATKEMGPDYCMLCPNCAYYCASTIYTDTTTYNNRPAEELSTLSTSVEKKLQGLTLVLSLV